MSESAPGVAEAWVVGQADSGLRLDVALSRRLSEPRARSQQRLAAGQVTVEGTTAGKSRRLAIGEHVVVHEPPPQEPTAAPPPVPVRYEDEWLLVVAKPADLVVHEGAGVSGGTLVDALAAMGVPLAPTPGSERPGIVHRLDRGTSGLLAVAKSEEAYHGLAGMLARREVTRRYWVLVDGVPDQPLATIDAPIARHPTQRTRFRTAPDGKPAVTHYDLEEAFGDAARLTVRLETGRTHQVRVHLSAIGHPVAGDGLYGASVERARRLRLDRPALHAAHLSFTHPITHEPVEVEEPAPAELLRALDVLRGVEGSAAS